MQTSPRTAAVDRRLEAVLSYIESHPGDPMPLESLAAMASLSVWRFATVFREQVGLPPHRYINAARVRHAQGLLREGMSLATVATAAGFCDQSHLTRRFKGICSMTPGEYQSNHLLGVDRLDAGQTC